MNIYNKFHLFCVQVYKKKSQQYVAIKGNFPIFLLQVFLTCPSSVEILTKLYLKNVYELETIA